MHNEGKMQNVKVSIEKYTRDNLMVVEGLKIGFEGLLFETEGLSEWVLESILRTGGSDYHRQINSNGNYGQTTTILINLNIFVNKENTKKTNRHYEIRDLIADYFKIGTEIDLYQFGDMVTSLQKMKIREIVTDRAIQNENFFQYNYTVGIDWLEKW